MIQPNTDSPGALKANESGPYDVVISGGRVLDPETGLDAVRHVGIKGGRIAAISEQPLEGARVLKADGQVVAPGFIDLHAHGQEWNSMWIRAFDGVTTCLELESGLLPIGMYYDHVASEGRPINYGAGSSATFARVAVKQKEMPPPDGTLNWMQKAFSYDGWQNSVASAEEIDEMMDMVEAGLNEGGLGISINGGYAPGYGRKEYYAIAKLAAKHNVSTFTHDRYMSIKEPNSAFEAIEEQIALAAVTGANMHVCHLNSVAGRDISDCADLLKAAQANGLPLTVEAYPYGAFSTAIGADFLRGPHWKETFGVKDASALEYNGKPLTQAEIDERQKNSPGDPIILHFLGDEDDPNTIEKLDQSVLYPGAAIASDALPWADASGKFIPGDIWPLPKGAFSHPRSSGCYSRFISRWVRERKKLSLLEAMRKTSLIPAQILEPAVPQMKSKGRIQVGADADVVVFDLNTIRDKSTFTDPKQLSVGFRHVVVNGTPIIEDGNRQGDARPGKPVRRTT
jgi:N-acyl-D-aspartate/D-glutamate deacylase